jgi:hypothetical protein
VTPLASHIPYARIKEIFDPPAKGSATNIYLQQIVVVIGSALFCLIRKNPRIFLIWIRPSSSFVSKKNIIFRNDQIGYLYPEMCTE